jgi:hypothetical protein
MQANAAVENWQLYPVSQFRGSFEHEHDDEHEEDEPLLADLGVISVERHAALRSMQAKRRLIRQILRRPLAFDDLAPESFRLARRS